MLGLEQASFRKNTGCVNYVFIISSIMSTYLAQKKKLFVTLIDYEKAFDKVDHGLLWQKQGQAKITGKVSRVVQSLYQKTKARVRVNGELTDVFDCNKGVRQGDNSSPLRFISFVNDFNNLIRTEFEGICLNAERSEEFTTFLKMYSLLYADDTLLLSETEEDMQRALDATLKNCIQNKMTIIISKTKFMICSRGKIRKQSTVYIIRTAIERVDTFCYLGIMLKYNNTFQAAMKNNVDKAKKALFKLDVLMSRIDLEIDTKIHLFDVMIKPLLLYGCEEWGHGDIEQIEVFHRNFFRRLLRIQKSAPKAMTYGELGQQELKFTIWQRKASFWKKLSYDKKVLRILCFG